MAPQIMEFRTRLHGRHPQQGTRKAIEIEVGMCVVFVQRVYVHDKVGGSITTQVSNA